MAYVWDVQICFSIVNIKKGHSQTVSIQSISALREACLISGLGEKILYRSHSLKKYHKGPCRGSRYAVVWNRGHSFWLFSTEAPLRGLAQSRILWAGYFAGQARQTVIVHWFYLKIITDPHSNNKSQELSFFSDNTYTRWTCDFLWLNTAQD